MRVQSNSGGMPTDLNRLTRMLTLLVAVSVSTGARLCYAADADDSARALASQLIERNGVGRGVGAVLGDGDLALALAGSSEFLVHARAPDAVAVERLRERGQSAGLGIDRFAVEWGGWNPLPYAGSTIDVVAVRQTADSSAAVRPDEILRVLRPEGSALIRLVGGNADTRVERLRAWSGEQGVDDFDVARTDDETRVWFRKPAFAGADEWTHWEKGPDNNPVSTDAIIQAPYMTQFLAEPYYIAMPSITTAAGGRTFLAIGHIAHHKREWDTLYRLIARNGYNGTVLWERQLTEGYLVHRSAFIATKETFYMIDGDNCLMLDAKTGAERGRIRIAGLEGDWKWMVMTDGVLYVLGGKPDPRAQATRGDRSFGGWSWADLSPGYYTKPHIPYGFGDTLAAYDLAQQKTLWTHKEETLIDSRGMAIRDGKVYLYCPDRHLRALAAESGNVLWTNGDADVLGLIEQPGRGLTSTPGFRTACMTVATPDALIIQGQTRMNVVAVSTADGYLLWNKKKITNNPNAIYVDGKVILGVGEGGSHVALDPVSGEVEEDLKFHKRACTRLTASPDSFFCRGEGTLRYDRQRKKLLIDGAIRPACNDGAMPANGLLYLGPWQCDCNLSVIGHVARCSAGDFRFDHVATEADRLERGSGARDAVAAFEMDDADWPTFRGDLTRSASSPAPIPENVRQRWAFAPQRAYVPTAPTSAGGFVFTAGDDGFVRAISRSDGAVKWEFATPSPIKFPPTIADGRAFVGCGDGYVYALEAATGRLLWRFRAAPVERHIMTYGRLGSTWPVNSGVLVHDGVAYFAAGIIDHDGTYVYAVDAATGRIRWQNHASGHLSDELRKGVSVQGNLTLRANRLYLAGGNQVSPAPFNLTTGECLANSFDQGEPKANNGQFVGVFRDEYLIAGGRILYAAPENVPTKGSFQVFSRNGVHHLNFGGIPPAWNDDTVALVNFKFGRLTCFDAPRVAEQIEKGYGPPRRPGARRWLSSIAESLESADAERWRAELENTDKFEAVSLAISPNAVVAVVQMQEQFRAQSEWFVVAFDAADGSIRFRQVLRGDPLPGGLLIDRDGRIVVTMLDGRVLCFEARNG